MPAVAATMKPATMASTVKSSTAVELTSTMEAAYAPKAFMLESSASKTVMVPATSAEVTAPVIAAAIVAAAVKTTMPVIPVIPRPRSDKHAIDEPFRAVVAIRRASVRIIIIVAVGTYRRWANISWAHSYAHNYSLRARKRSAKQANAE
jgi:hypothetical protein